MPNKNNITSFPEFETERLLIRKVERSDAKDIFDYASDPETSKHLPWDEHQSIDDTLDFIDTVNQKFFLMDNIDWGIELKSEKKLIGMIGFREWNNQNSCADIGYVLSPKYWNKGYITEAVKAVIKFGFDKVKVNRIEAHCDEKNISSSRVLEKCGMKYEGTLRKKVMIKNRFVNMKFYSILLEDYINDKS